MAARRLAAALALAAWFALAMGPAVFADATPAPSPAPSAGGSPGPGQVPTPAPTIVPAPAAPAATPSPATPSGPASQCQGLDPKSPGGLPARIACDVAAQGPGGAISDVANSAGQAAQAAGQGIAQSAESDFSNWLAAGASWMAQAVLAKITSSSTTPNLDPAHAAAFARIYGRVVGVALSLSVLLILIGVIEAVLTQRPGALRRVVIGIAVSGIGMGAVPIATAILLRVVDDLSSYVVMDQSQTITTGLQTTIQLLRTQTGAGGSGAAFAWTALGLLIGGGVLWLELVTRDALIYLYLAVVPLACAAVQWPRLEGVLRQTLFAGLALILSKLVIAIALGVGFAVMASSTVPLETLLAGMFILLLAALSPFTLARVLPLAAEELSHDSQGRLRATMVGAASSAPRMIHSLASGGVLAGQAMSNLVAPPMGSSGVPVIGAGRGASPGSGGADRRVVVAGSDAGGISSSAPGAGAPAPGPGAAPPGPPRSLPAVRWGGSAASPAPPRGPEPPRDGGLPPAA